MTACCVCACHCAARRHCVLQLCQLEVNSAKGDLMRNIKLEGRNITNVKGMHWPDQ